MMSAIGKGGTTREEWRSEGARLFGESTRAWRFVCPSCGHHQTISDMFEAEMPSSAIAFSCVGRWREDDGDTPVVGMNEPDQGLGCNYAGGGLFQINPRLIVLQDGVEHHIFDFAPESPDAK